MKKILFITPYTPSRIAAAENFTRQVLLDFPADYEVDLAYFSTIEGQTYAAEKPNIHPFFLGHVTRKERIRMCLSLPFLFPLFSVRFRRPVLNMLRKMHKEKHYDLIYCDHSQTFLYGTYFPGVPKILMAHDIEFQRFGRKYGRLAEALCAATEKKMIGQPHASVLTFSEKDSALVREKFGIESRPVNFYMDENVVCAEPKEEHRDRFVFFANWARPDNSDGLVWFLDNVLPHLKSRDGISVIGGGADDLLKKKMADSGVRYSGFLENPYPEIAGASAVIAPLFQGAGVKVKVIESLACGTPVIGTEIAFEGVSRSFRDALYPCATPAEFAETINSFRFPLVRKKKLKKLFFEEANGMTPVRVIQEIFNGNSIVPGRTQ